MAETIKKLAEKEEELAQKVKKNSDLELKLKAQEKGFKDKITYLNQMVAKYKRQAEESAAQNADLLLQSHRQNVMRSSVEYEKPTNTNFEGVGARQQQVDSRISSASSSSSHSSSPRRKSSPKIKPALQPHAPKEPKEMRPLSSGKLRSRAKIGTFDVPEGHPVLRDTDPVKMRISRRLSGQEDEVVPDPKPFLQLTHEQKRALRQSAEFHRQPSKPLPPIAKSTTLSRDTLGASVGDKYDPKPPSSRRNPPVLPPNKADSANFKKLKERNKGSTQSVEVDMETLALEDITKSSVSNLRRAQEYGSD